MKSIAPSRILTTCAALSLALVARNATAADTVVQVPVDSVIDGRTVSTIAGGTITPWVAGQGVDGDGGGDGYVTNAVETALVPMNKTVGGKAGVALPDDGMFPMNDRHPAVLLHFSNTASTTSPQTHQIYQAASRGAQMFQFNVPQATYSKMFLFITASEGAANLTITLNYAGGAAPTVKMVKLPDYGVGGAGANDPVFFNLIAGMRKWNSMDNEGDGTSHTITGIELDLTGTDMMTSIKVEKTNGSHCVFWGATGIATSAVTTGAGGSGGAGGSTDAGTSTDAGASGGAGGAGGATGGTAGAGGAGGATATGGNGGSTATGAAGATAGAAGTGGGAAGTTGTTGQGGSNGSTSGTAGSPGAPARASSGGGCSFAGASSRGGTAATLVLVAAACGLGVRRRRRRG